ncbi:MAG: polysaccharide biosynthesis tyrosine autokinase [Bacteroidetes bacterium]|nr:polysaccharide biosynthesis tyrosine autokinase [Bacteroidota bacterium]
MNSTNNAIVDKEDIKKIILVFLRNWYLFVGFVVIAVIAAKFYIHRSTTIYSVSSTLLLEPSNSTDLRTSVLEGLGINPHYESISNEMRVIRSHKLMEETLSKLDLRISYFIKGKLNTFEVYQGLPFKVEGEIFNSKFYAFPFTLKIKSEFRYELSYELDDNFITEKLFFNRPFVNENYSITLFADKAKIKALISGEAGVNNVDYIFQINSVDALVAKYLGALRVSNIEWSNLVELSIEDVLPERAKEVLDTLAVVYIEHSLETKRLVNKNTVSFIDAQLSQVIYNLDSIENLMEQFKKREDVIDISNEQQLYFNELTKHEKAKMSKEMKIKSLEFLYSYIEANEDTATLPTSLFSVDDDKYLMGYLDELFGLQKFKIKALLDRQENSPSMERLYNAIAILRANILQYILNTKEVLKDQIIFEESEIARYIALVDDVPRTQREMLNIQRKININEDIYVHLLKMRSETMIARAGIVSEKSVVERARSMGILRPNKSKIIYTSVGVGLILALVVIFIQGLFVNKISNQKELRELSSIPILGTIGQNTDKAAQYMVVQNRSTSVIAEEFRAIRIKLESLPSIGKCKMVVITSCVKNQGKSFCAINIASILAKSNKKVLLLELDLHKPKLQSAMKLTNHVGLTSYLEEGKEIHEVVKHSDIENLDVILAGPRSENPSELIVSEKMEDLIDEFKEEYDYIIVDTPPVGLLTDALVFMKKADVNLYVILAKGMKKSYLETAEQIKEQNNPSNFYILLNGVKSTNLQYGYA